MFPEDDIMSTCATNHPRLQCKLNESHVTRTVQSQVSWPDLKYLELTEAVIFLVKQAVPAEKISKTRDIAPMSRTGLDTYMQRMQTHNTGINLSGKTLHQINIL